MSSKSRTKRKNRLGKSPLSKSYVPETPNSSSSGDKKGHNVKKNIKNLLESVDVLKATIQTQFKKKIFKRNVANRSLPGNFDMNFLLTLLKIYLDRLEHFYYLREFKNYKLQHVIELVHQAIETVRLYCQVTKVFHVTKDKVKLESLRERLQKQYSYELNQPSTKILLDYFLVNTNNIIQIINTAIAGLERSRKTKKNLNKKARVKKLSDRFKLLEEGGEYKVKNRLNNGKFIINLNAFELSNSS